MFNLFLYRWFSLVRKKHQGRTHFFDIVFINPDMIIYGYSGLNPCLISWVLQRLEYKQSALNIGLEKTFYAPGLKPRDQEPGSTSPHPPPPPRKVKSVRKTNYFSRFFLRDLAIYRLSKKLFLNKIYRVPSVTVSWRYMWHYTYTGAPSFFSDCVMSWKQFYVGGLSPWYETKPFYKKVTVI